MNPNVEYPSEPSNMTSLLTYMCKLPALAGPVSKNITPVFDYTGKCGCFVKGFVVIKLIPQNDDPVHLTSYQI